MIMTLTETDFIELTNKYSQHKDNFSYEGKKALFQYLNEFETDTGNRIEFDYIALCCDYSEYDNLDDLFEAYDWTKKQVKIAKRNGLPVLKALTITELKEHTEVIEFTKYDFDNFKDREYKSYIIRDF